MSPPGRPDDLAAGPPVRPRVQAPTEVLLLLVSLVSVSGFTRIFADDSVVAALLLAAVAAHLTAAGARRRGLGGLATAGLIATALVLQVSVVLYPHVSLAGLPTGATAAAAGDDLARAWNLFDEVQAPAPSERGFVLAATIAIWLAATLADWAGMRLRITAEAVLPAVALFVFTLLLGDGGTNVVAAAALAAAVGGFALAQRTARTAVEDTWVGDRAAAGARSLARSGGAVVLAVAVTAGVVAPRLPGADSAAIRDWRGRESSARTTISPLVDIRSRLVQQSDAVAFRVRADRPAYWRLTSLDHFNGQIWALSNTEFSKADGRLPADPPEATTRELEQEFAIASLGTLWAPAALTPVEVRSADADLRWNGGMATLIVPQALEDVDGLRYQVVSQVPEFTPEDLDAALPDPLPDDLAEAVELPPGMPSAVRDLAEEVTAEAGTTPYARALALQDWFRREFTYSLDRVPAGHGENAITAFLTAREGYCEQFAGTFAVMARSLGIPARVAVGYTSGDVDADGRTYTVRGRNAHAWPEVHIPGAGWVPFEPTPNRGQPGTEAYTGVAPAQDRNDSIPELPTTTAPPPLPPSVTATTEGGPSDTRPEDNVRAAAPAEAPGGGSSDGSGPAAIALAVGAVALGLGVAEVVGLAVLRALRRRRRRRIAEVGSRVRLAWEDAVSAASALGRPPTPAETDAEFAARAGEAVGPAAPALARLAALVDRATWSPSRTETDPALVVEADDLAHQVREEARRRLGPGQRLRMLVDPRPELRAR